MNSAKSEHLQVVIQKNYLLLSIVILIAAASLYLWHFDSFQVGTYSDDSQYIILARSIEDGPEFGLINQPGQVLPTRYPFGWPLILALFANSSEQATNFNSLKFVSMAFTLGNILVILLGWKLLGWENKYQALMVASFFAFSSLVVGHARMVMSEPAFLFIVLIGIIFSYYSPKNRSSAVFSALLLGSAWFFAIYVRTIGISLIVANFLYLVIKKRWATIVIASVAFFVTLLLIVSLSVIDLQDSINLFVYQDQLSNPDDYGHNDIPLEFMPRLLNGVSSYALGIFRESMFPFIGNPTATSLLSRLGLGFFPLAITIILDIAIIAGYLISFQHIGLHPTHLYIPAYLLILFLWPWRGSRFLYGIYPFLFGYLVLSVWEMIKGLQWSLRNHHKAYYTSTFLSLMMLLTIIGLQVFNSLMIDDSLEHVRDFKVGTTWINQNTPEKSVVMAEEPQTIFLYSQRQSVNLNQDLSYVQKLACQNPLFIMIAPKLVWQDDGKLIMNPEGPELINSIQMAGIDLELRYENKAELVQVYQVNETCE